MIGGGNIKKRMEEGWLMPTNHRAPKVSFIYEI